MTTASLLALATLPVVVAGVALSAFAQHDDEPVAAVDKMVVEATFTKADANGDGKLTAAEASLVPLLSPGFDELDKDEDRRLDLKEFAAGVQAPG
jgi:hypothetical protein